MNVPLWAPTTGARRTVLRHARLPMMVAALLCAHAQAAEPPAAAADEFAFDPAFLPAGASARLDLERFAQADYVAPGTYRGDIRVNQQWRGRGDIVYRDVDGRSQLCLLASELERHGLAPAKLGATGEALPVQAWPADGFCGDIGRYVPGATASFDAGTQVLDLQIPQIYLRNEARGYVDPSQWDGGINALSLGYTSNVYRYTSSGRTRYSGFVGLNATARLGSWQLVHQGALSLGGTQDRRYQSNAAYLQHDIVPWQAQLILGDTSTNGELFDSVRLRGLRLGSDDRMLPQSLRGFAPVVRGVAETNARVVVRQHGAILHEVSVAPGPFVIEDLYSTGYAGDLDVEVLEADGRSRRFTLPYSSVPQLLRPGQTRWHVAAGRIEEASMLAAPALLQAQAQHGLTNTLSVYAGTALGQDYRSALAGAAFNTRVGAFAADITTARTAIADQPGMTGSSFRLGYNRNVVATGTNFAVAAYRYSTSGYASLRDWAALRDAQARGWSADAVSRQRNRMDISMNQRLGERGGQLFVIGTRRDFWNTPGQQLDLSIGYSNQWRSLSYSVNFQRTRDSIDFTRGYLQDSIPGDVFQPAAPAQTRVDNRLMLMVSMPLGKAPRAPQLNLMHNRSGQGEPSTQLSTNGIAAADERFSYGATLSRVAGENVVDVNGGYRGARGQVMANMSHGSNYQQFGLGVSGGAVLHGGGLTLSPPLGDTMALIHADGATGARVESGAGARVDKRGYALVPYLTPYQLNTVSIDPKGTDVSLEMEETARSVAPRAGALVRLEFPTRRTRAVMIDALTDDGRPLPFGAEVTDTQGASVGVVGQGGRVIVNGLQASGTVSVQWGSAEHEQCSIEVYLPDTSNTGAYSIVSANCRQIAAQPDADTRAPQRAANAAAPSPRNRS